MKITKYGQSCLLVEMDSARVLVDPGSFVVGRQEPEVFGELDAVLYTHRHGDHFQVELIAPLVEQGAQIVTNADVASLVGEHPVTVLGDRDRTTIGGVSVQAHEIAHCPMVDGSAGPPNTGFVIGNTLLHPGDGLEAPAEVEVVAVPIAGPSVSMRDAYRMVRQAKASTAVPIHYDFFIAKPEQFAGACDIAEVRVLAEGETADLGPLDAAESH